MIKIILAILSFSIALSTYALPRQGQQSAPNTSYQPTQQRGISQQAIPQSQTRPTNTGAQNNQQQTTDQISNPNNANNTSAPEYEIPTLYCPLGDEFTYSYETGDEESPYTITLKDITVTTPFLITWDAEWSFYCQEDGCIKSTTFTQAYITYNSDNEDFEVQCVGVASTESGNLQSEPMVIVTENNVGMTIDIDSLSENWQPDNSTNSSKYMCTSSGVPTDCAIPLAANNATESTSEPYGIGRGLESCSASDCGFCLGSTTCQESSDGCECQDPPV